MLSTAFLTISGSVAKLIRIKPLKLAPNHSPKSIAKLHLSWINSFTLSIGIIFLKSKNTKYVPSKLVIVISGICLFNSDFK